MRYYVFLSLAGIALLLDVFLAGLSLWYPEVRLHFGAPAVVLSASQGAPSPASAQVHPALATALVRPTRAPVPPTPPPATATPSPTPAAPATATPTPSPMPTATATPEPPPRIVASGAASFAPSNSAVRANIRLALEHYQGALAHVVVAPGGAFSFNAALGIDPERLPWKNVVARAPTAVPAADPAAPDAPPTDALAPIVSNVEGGGLCDLASRYVMAARPLLPPRAFHFVNHVQSTGIRLHGVPVRDSVSIWAVGGHAGEHDLVIKNVTGYWLEFVVERVKERITVRARLWDRIPPL